jgi:hypothetical protein
MSEYRKRSSTELWVGVTLGGIPVAPILYVALLGPMYSLSESGIISRDLPARDPAVPATGFAASNHAW